VNAPLKIWLSIVLLGLAAYGGYSGWRWWKLFNQTSDPVRILEITPDATHADEVRELSPVQLFPLDSLQVIGADGQPFDFDRLRGKVWIAKLFFTSCPSICHQMTTNMRMLQDTEAMEDLHLVSVSCDPDNDTPEALRRYARRYGADVRRWHFLAGPMAEVKVLGNDLFGLPTDRQTHSRRIIVVDRKGVRRAAVDLTDQRNLAPLRQMLRELLAESADEVKTPESTADGVPKAEAADPDQGAAVTADPNQGAAVTADPDQEAADDGGAQGAEATGSSEPGQAAEDSDPGTDAPTAAKTATGGGDDDAPSALPKMP
jgi:cytochrome oxidase Cu insertion factor (SCO1/SenC/PrrC family)